MKKLILAGAVCMLTASSAFAQSVVDSAAGAVGSITDGWSGSATLGATNSTGNAEAQSISGAIRLGKTVGQWEHLVFGSIIRGESTIIVDRLDAQGDPITNADGSPVRDIVTASNSERFALGYQPKFYWRPNTYFFGILDWETDEPANIDSSTRQVIGIGHKFWSTPQGYMSGEVGFGNKILEPVNGSDLSGGIGYLGLNYLNRVSEALTFNADLKADFGGDNTFTELGLGLAYKVSEKMALKLSHFLRSNSDLTNPSNPLDADNDTVTTFNLVFDI